MAELNRDEAALALIRSHGIGLHSPDLDDAIRQLLQAQQIESSTAITAVSNLATFRAERDEARALAEKYLGALESAKNTAKRRGELNRKLAALLLVVATDAVCRCSDTCERCNAHRAMDLLAAHPECLK